MNTMFADISDNNANVNIAMYANAGYGAIAIKATEGTDYVNPDHRAWTNDAHKYGLAVIHYHFARPDIGNDPYAEALFFARVTVPQTSGRDYLVVDMERGGLGNADYDPSFCALFCHDVRSLSRFSPIVYANRSTLQASDGWIVYGPRRVWDADWSDEPDYAPSGYECVFRQFTNGTDGPGPHSAPGIGDCDMNLIGGPMWAEMRARARR